ncbi:MAG: cytochrome c3 family protein [bacterium]
MEKKFLWIMAFIISVSILTFSYPAYSGGEYENSAHGDPVTGVNKVNNFAVGECEHCHSQHAGNKYNLPKSYKNEVERKEFCYACHSEAMDNGYYPGKTVYDASSNNSHRKMACSDQCHTPHGSSLRNMVRDDAKGQKGTSGCLKGAGCHGSDSDRHYFNALSHAPGSGEKYEIGNFDGNGDLSHHDLGFKDGETAYLSCSNCHSPHQVKPFAVRGSFNSSSSPIIDPFNPASKVFISNQYLRKEENNFCLGCHNNNPPEQNPTFKNSKENEFPLTVAFPPGSKHMDVELDWYGSDRKEGGGDDGGHIIKSLGGTIPQGEKLPCVRCHYPHESKNEVLFERYYDDNGVKPPSGLKASSSWSTFGTGNGREICLSCHNGTTKIEGINVMSPPPFSSASYHNNDTNGSECTVCHNPHRANVLGISGPSHDLHLSVANGPHIDDCFVCHKDPFTWEGEKILFIDDKPLTMTTSCNNCHSPKGTYDGVSDPIIGVRYNWEEGVYEDNGALKQGKEKWCAGCHDEYPANSKVDNLGINAPDVIGREQETIRYGTGYGFYKTGHGLPKTENYPASGAPGAGAQCLDCHDTIRSHIDHKHRSYQSSLNNYQQGYRLRYSMAITRDIVNGKMHHPPQIDEFKLCFNCHASTPFINEQDMTTNFRNGSTTINSHYLHLDTGHGQGNQDYSWDSDWDGIVDSDMSCTACHNVHGSPSPRMVRHGELISTYGTQDKVPALEFTYLPNPNTTLEKSTGGTTKFWEPGSGTVAKNKVCNMCHNDSYSYSRQPTIQLVITSIITNDASGGGCGIQDGDQVIINFSKETNGSTVITNKDELSEILPVLDKSWGTGTTIAWSTKVYDNDTLTITLSADATIVIGNVITPDKALCDNYGNPVANQKRISGTLGCASITMAKAKDQNKKEDIQQGDQVIILFSFPTKGNKIDNVNIESALILNNGHKWGIISSATWSNKTGNNDTLTITLGTGATIAVSDKITLGDTIKDDIFDKAISGDVNLGGSFDPIILSAIAYDAAGDKVKGYYDYVKIRFSIPTNGYPINVTALDDTPPHEVDEVLKLTNGHCWMSANTPWPPQQHIYIHWLSEKYLNDVLIVHVLPGGSPLRKSTVEIGDVITLGEQITDSYGYFLAGEQITITGSWDGDNLRTVVANDASGKGGCIQDGDKVIINFDKETNGYLLDASNIDSYLELNNKHKWRDGSDHIGSAIWSSAGGRQNDTLTVTLSCKNGCPTISVGDIVTFGEVIGGGPGHWESQIKDKQGAGIAGISIITGNFGGASPVITSVSPRTINNAENEIIITGTGFICVNEVIVDELNVKEKWSVANDTTIKLTIPAGTPLGRYDITVRTSDGLSAITEKNNTLQVGFICDNLCDKQGSQISSNHLPPKFSSSTMSFEADFYDPDGVSEVSVVGNSLSSAWSYLPMSKDSGCTWSVNPGNNDWVKGNGYYFKVTDSSDNVTFIGCAGIQFTSGQESDVKNGKTYPYEKGGLCF